MSDSAYMNREQTCAHLGISAKSGTLEEWMRRDGFPKPGRHGRWSRAKVDRYMQGEDDGAEKTVASGGWEQELQEMKNASEAFFAQDR